MDLSKYDIFMTGGSGTLGMAIAERRRVEEWSGKLTVYSTDNHKHDSMRRIYPDVNFVQGDIRSELTLFNSMVGHDIVLHLAAVKVIPDAEWWSLDTIDVNVNGSIAVCAQARAAGIKHVLGISTDKACHPANAYGASKMLMEKIFQEFARNSTDCKYHLVRYGNVLESNGSVLQAWKNADEHLNPIKITDPEMTRFWLSPQQAVDYVLKSLDLENGHIYIPMMKSLSLGKLSKYYLEKSHIDMERIPIRPGEKQHECLLTIEELNRAYTSQAFFDLLPSTDDEIHPTVKGYGYTSDLAPELTKEELFELLNDERSS